MARTDKDKLECDIQSLCDIDVEEFLRDDDDHLSVMRDPLDDDIDWNVDDVDVQSLKRPRHNSDASCCDDSSRGSELPAEPSSTLLAKRVKGRSNAYCLTLNNPTDEERVVCKEWIVQNAEYGIVGNEVGESGTPHLQVYFRCKNARVFNAIKTKFPGSHIESANSGDKENQKYCSKGGDFWEHGTVSKQVLLPAGLFFFTCKYSCSMQPYFN